MHLGFKFEVIYANSTRETLLSVPNYSFQWQALYRLAQPKYIPKGSRILCTAFWDNTWQNTDIREAYYTTDLLRCSLPILLPGASGLADSLRRNVHRAS